MAIIRLSIMFLVLALTLHTTTYARNIPVNNAGLEDQKNVAAFAGIGGGVALGGGTGITGGVGTVSGLGPDGIPYHFIGVQYAGTGALSGIGYEGGLGGPLLGVPVLGGGGGLGALGGHGGGVGAFGGVGAQNGGVGGNIVGGSGVVVSP